MGCHVSACGVSHFLLSVLKAFVGGVIRCDVTAFAVVPEGMVLLETLSCVRMLDEPVDQKP